MKLSDWAGNLKPTRKNNSKFYDENNSRPNTQSYRDITVTECRWEVDSSLNERYSWYEILWNVDIKNVAMIN